MMLQLAARLMVIRASDCKLQKPLYSQRQERYILYCKLLSYRTFIYHIRVMNRFLAVCFLSNIHYRRLQSLTLLLFFHIGPIHLRVCSMTECYALKPVICHPIYESCTDLNFSFFVLVSICSRYSRCSPFR